MGLADVYEDYRDWSLANYGLLKLTGVKLEKLEDVQAPEGKDHISTGYVLEVDLEYP